MDKLYEYTATASDFNFLMLLVSSTGTQRELYLDSEARNWSQTPQVYNIILRTMARNAKHVMSYLNAN